MLAAETIATRETPRGIRKDPKRLEAFQKRLESQGIELAWPSLTPR